MAFQFTTDPCGICFVNLAAAEHINAIQEHSNSFLCLCVRASEWLMPCLCTITTFFCNFESFNGFQKFQNQYAFKTFLILTILVSILVISCLRLIAFKFKYVKLDSTRVKAHASDAPETPLRKRRGIRKAVTNSAME